MCFSFQFDPMKIVGSTAIQTIATNTPYFEPRASQIACYREIRQVKVAKSDFESVCHSIFT